MDALRRALGSALPLAIALLAGCYDSPATDDASVTDDSTEDAACVPVTSALASRVRGPTFGR